MSANTQPYFVPYDSKELLRRPLEPRLAFAIDPPRSKEVDDAIDVEFCEDDSGRHAKITTYIADAALLATYPDILNDAAEIGFSTYDGPNSRSMLPSFVLQQLGLNTSVTEGVPAIAVRMKAYEHGATLCDIERVRVRVRTMTYQKFGYIAASGNKKARDIVKASRIIAHKGTFKTPYFDSTNPHDVVAQHMLLTNKLIARSMRHLETPFIYREHLQRGTRGPAYAMYNDSPSPHESLKAPQYCHFTSPLRRFPDLANHINLAAIMDGREPTFGSTETKEIATYINQQMSRIPYYQKAA